MELKKLNYDLTVCKVENLKDINQAGFFFIGNTGEEISLVCETEKTPDKTIAREDGWKAFKIEGELDFALVGILSKISTILAENNIGIFAVSTYNTDYILVKRGNFEKAIIALTSGGYNVT